MPGEPTERESTKEAARAEISGPRFATVETLHYHEDGDDDALNEADVTLSGSDTPIPKVPIQQPAAGMAVLPQEGALVRVEPTGGGAGGGAGQPVITGVIPTAEDNVPLTREGDRLRLQLGDGAVVESRKVDGTRTLNIGFQAADGGSITNGIVLRKGERPTLPSPDGENLLAQRQPAGGGAPGGPGGPYESIPTGGAGGDGTGVGDPQFSPSSETAIEAGGGPINEQLRSAGGDTLVKLQPGEHRLQPEGDSGIVLGQNKLWLQGQGETREDTRLTFPPGKAGRMFNLSGRVAISNLTFDQRNHPSTMIGVTCSGADSYIYNCRHWGKTPNDANVGQPFAAGDGGGYQFTVGMDGGATARIENHRSTEREVGILSYSPSPNNSIWLQAPNGHAGLLEAVNCHVSWRGEHAVYGSRCEGDVHIEKGYYSNNINTNARISGSGSYIKDATIHLNMAPSRQIDENGEPKATRGLRVESGNYGFSGGHAENCDFIIESQLQAAPLIALEDSSSDFEVRNCRFWSSNDQDNVAEVSMDGAVFTNCSFVGPTSMDMVNGAGDTVVENSCVQAPNSTGLVNCNTSNISTSGCAVPGRVQ